MQGPQNSTKHDISIIGTRKYTMSQQKNNMSKLTIHIFLLTIIIFLYYWAVKQTQANRK